MKTAGIREFKAKLSQYLAEVRRGEVVLVTDRGEVVAEVRQPAWPGSDDHRVCALWPLVRSGELRLGDPTQPGGTRRGGIPAGVTSDAIDRELGDSREGPVLAAPPTPAGVAERPARYPSKRRRGR
jgi:antitoxin (DNA-binding transcriptional repressor) of toxin-antitoxin stability system